MISKPSKEEVMWLFDALRKVSFFSIASLDNIDKIISRFTKEHYDKGQVIIKEAESASGLYIIKSGSCLVYRQKSFFRKEKLTVLKEGDFFGEMSLLFDAPTSANIQAVEPTDCFVYLKTDFLELLSMNKDMEEKLRFIAEKRKMENATER